MRVFSILFLLTISPLNQTFRARAEKNDYQLDELFTVQQILFVSSLGNI